MRGMSVQICYVSGCIIVTVTIYMHMYIADAGSLLSEMNLSGQFKFEGTRTH